MAESGQPFRLTRSQRGAEKLTEGGGGFIWEAEESWRSDTLAVRKERIL